MGTTGSITESSPQLPCAGVASMTPLHHRLELVLSQWKDLECYLTLLSSNCFQLSRYPCPRSLKDSPRMSLLTDTN
jgi:hypothetical protein